jgi:predicted  nucleic acid-binding Zn-ribbon protein
MAESTPADASKIRELTRTVADLECQLESARRQTETAKLKAESLARDLDEKENELREYDVEKIETETKIHTLSRSKDELRAKVTELSSRLERKEREVREVSDRYKMYVTELESKLDQDTDAKHNLQLEIDKLRSTLSAANEVSTEASELRQKVYSLEKSLEDYRGKARDNEAKSKESVQSLRDQLDAATRSKESIEEALKKATAEKAEVIAALEGVINEVQNREDEIESLSELLQRRDEELQHAKIIATKALQSAKDIQKRYKDKDQDRHTDLMDRMNEVSDNVDRLSTQNESLQLKIKSLERDLRDRNLECKRLKDQLRQIDGKNILKDDVSAISTQSTYSMSHSGSTNGIRGIDMDHRLDPPMSLDSESFSPSNSPRQNSNNFEAVFGNDGFPAVEKQMSVDSYDGSHAASSTTLQSSEGNRWPTDFENESAYSTKSRKSLERDALRKYVRSRYQKRGEKATF